jgi:hypothetical protein
VPDGEGKLVVDNRSPDTARASCDDCHLIGPARDWLLNRFAESPRMIQLLGGALGLLTGVLAVEVSAAEVKGLEDHNQRRGSHKEAEALSDLPARRNGGQPPPAAPSVRPVPLAQIAPGDFDIAVVGQMPATNLPLGDEFERGLVKMVGFEAPFRRGGACGSRIWNARLEIRTLPS